MDSQIANFESPDFDAIKKSNSFGAELWSARELAPVLGYKQWRNFESAISKATAMCQRMGEIVEDHFVRTSRVIIAGKGARQTVEDYLLSRYGCYLVVQNCDARKP